MQFLIDAMQRPVDNFLGIFLYLFLLITLTITATALLLFLIPNRLTTRVKNAIIGSVTFLVFFCWLYFVVISRL